MNAQPRYALGLGLRNQYRLPRRKPSREIRFDVLNVLQTYRNANQVLSDTRGLALLITEPAMSGGRRMHDGGLGIPKIRGDRQHPGAIDNAPGLRTTLRQRLTQSSSD